MKHITPEACIIYLVGLGDVLLSNAEWADYILFLIAALSLFRLGLSSGHFTLSKAGHNAFNPFLSRYKDSGVT